MDQLFRLKNTVVDYLSPLAKRRRTIGPTPATPTRDNDAPLFSNSDPQGARQQAAIFGKIRDKYETSPDIQNSRKRGRFEFEDEGSGISPNDSVSQFSSSEQEYDNDEDVGIKIEEADLNEIEDDLGQEEDEIEEEDLDAAAQAKVQEYLERQAELESRREDIERVKAAGDWHADELFLFERLTMRSFEELVPYNWMIDFPTLPDIIFTDDPENTFINYNCSSSGRGVKALQELLKLGSRVREKVAAGREPEQLIEREIKRYIDYTEKDGGFHRTRFIPVISVVKARPGQEIDSITKAITAEMTFLAEKHRESLGFSADKDFELDANKNAPPLLYGMIVARTMVVFVTLDSANPNASLRHILHFDFTVKKMDVWNGFAISIMAICARNYTMGIKDELEIDDDPISDPDI
ncbi:hypothetical protein LSUE1_G007364 [Lachnellula suecica]|uniref:Uncharacterized protein n=1 Tax=Lachnellula suecica TaxID=602035 RepID=A0A8T9BZ72_9HELO|nr:hypothetical protein LSUE1_G007364 [Lachnellula suecica]